MQQVLQKLIPLAMQGNYEGFLADANLFMEMASLVVVAWQWLKQAVVAQKQLLTQNLAESEVAFYEGKVQTMRYFFAYELPKTKWLATRLLDDEVITIVEEKTEWLV